MRHFDIDSLFFFKIWYDFFRNGFPNSLIVRSRSIFCLDNENSLNCTSGLVLLCFSNSLYLLIKFFVLHKSRFSLLTCDLLTVSTEWILISFTHWITQCTEYGRCTDKARSLGHSALGYQSSLEQLLPDISIELNSFRFKGWITYSFRI